MENKKLGAPIASGWSSEIFEWENSQILKLFRNEFPADWAEHELQIGRIVSAAGLSVPRIGEIVQINGRYGITYERVDGISLYDEFRKAPWKILTAGRQFAEIQAAIHRFQAPGELPSHKNRCADTIHAYTDLPEDWREALLRKLATLQDDNALCHYDFHPGNLLMSARGPVIIDWTHAARGNRLADVARTLLLLQFVLPKTRIKRLVAILAYKKFIADYLAHYSKIFPHHGMSVASWMPFVAAERLTGKIPGEEKRLLAMIRAGLE